MEIEAKFAIPDQDAMLRLQRVVRLGPFVPGKAVEREIRDVYLDTLDHALHRGGYACRLRGHADRISAELEEHPCATAADPEWHSRRHTLTETAVANSACRRKARAADR